MSGFWKTVLIVWLVSYAICLVDRAFVLYKSIKNKKHISYAHFLKHTLWEFVGAPIKAFMILSIWNLDVLDWLYNRMMNDEDKDLRV